MRYPRVVAILLIACLLLPAGAGAQQTVSAEPVVIAVLFYTDTCRLCHTVIREILPPLQEAYGSHLQIVYISTQGSQGYDLYRASCETLGIICVGVPMMLVGDTVLIGQMNIEALLPGLVEEGLAAGGVDLPPVPELIAAYDVWAQPEKTADVTLSSLASRLLRWLWLLLVDQITAQQ